MDTGYLGYNSTSTVDYKKYLMTTNTLAKEYGKYKAYTSEENQELFIQYHESKDPKIREKLILGNLKIAMKIAYKYISPDAAYDFDDILQVAVIGLIKSIDTFDYTKGYKFSSYAGKVISSQINMIWRKSKYLNLIISLETPIMSSDKSENITIADTLVDENTNIEKDVEHIVMCSLIESELDYLTEKERNIIIDKFGLYEHKPMLQRELAVKYGYSQGYICRIIASALSKLRVRLLSTI